MTGFAQYGDYDGLGLAELVRAGQVSAAELLEEAITRTERVNGQLNAVVHKLYEEARREIARACRTGPSAEYRLY